MGAAVTDASHVGVRLPVPPARHKNPKGGRASPTPTAPQCTKKLPWKEGIEIQGELGKGVDNQELLLLKITGRMIRVHHFDQAEARVDPNLDDAAFLIVLALPLNVAGAVTRGKNLSPDALRETLEIPQP